MSRTVPPSLRDLTARYLTAQAARSDAGVESEVEPHEGLGGFRPTAAQTWADAVSALAVAGLPDAAVPCPPQWAAFAAAGGPLAAVPLAGGFFPQRVADPSALFAGRTPPPAAKLPGFDALRQWVAASVGSGSAARLLLAAGVAAALGDSLTADAMIEVAEPLCVGPTRAAWENQRAAVAFAAGRPADWAGAPGPAGDFNRGVAALFGGRPGEAVAPLRRAADALPAGSGWASLAGLYATLAAARSRGHGF